MVLCVYYTCHLRPEAFLARPTHPETHMVLCIYFDLKLMVFEPFKVRQLISNSSRVFILILIITYFEILTLF